MRIDIPTHILVPTWVVIGFVIAFAAVIVQILKWAYDISQIGKRL